MKHQSIDYFRTALLVLAGVSVCSTALAQEATVHQHTYHPEEHVNLEVSFSGRGIEEIQNVGVAFNLASDHLSEQSGFETGFQGAPTDPRRPPTYTFSVPIPKRISTGDYALRITIDTKSGFPINYFSGKDFKFLIHIENSPQIQRPDINVTLKP
jgi:hypothetical protein